MEAELCEIAAIWSRIEEILKANALEERLADLLPGASARDIQALEETLNVRLPLDLADSYRIHNGQLDDGHLLTYGWFILTLEQIALNWKMLKKLSDQGEFRGNRV